MSYLSGKPFTIINDETFTFISNIFKAMAVHLQYLTLWALSQQLSSGRIARRENPMTWAIHFLIVSSTIVIQTYNRKSQNEEKNKEADDICDIHLQAVCDNF